MQSSDALDTLRATVRRHWGFDQFRPQQEQSIKAILDRRDSVVVVPTGGGKSLCYQAPAAMRHDALTVVVSPLIALMKDQVDALTARGIPSALFNSSLGAHQKREVVEGIRSHRYRLLYVAPERFPDAEFVELLRSVGVASIAVDEAHCISHWGHDFRPDYRRLSATKEWFPDAAVHAFTATATPRVREDIAEQLRMVDPVVLVGDFDRPNLTYRAKWRTDFHDQLCEIIDRDRRSAGIIYCIRRADVDELSAFLHQKGYRALPYHAGLSAEQRKHNQDAFSVREVEIIVATVAFGMGIDRPDIRFVVHAGMPKSIEAYHQETGRAGRDGLPAECTLFYTSADFMTWKSIVENSETRNLDAHITQLREIFDFCQSTGCRHAQLVGHFGQSYDTPSCGACDVCLGEIATIPDGTTVARKILSAIVRTGERFGAKYVADVLVGADEELIQTRGHAGLSVYGLLAEYGQKEIRTWIDQLASDGFLQVGTEYRTFSLSGKGWELLRDEHQVALFDRPELRRKTRRRTASESRRSSPSAERPVPRQVSDDTDEMDTDLYEALRKLRNKLAGERDLPGYCVVSNQTLTHIAAMKPTTQDDLLSIPGIGQKKLAQYGSAILDCVRQNS